MRPFPAGHASISASDERELASISGRACDPVRGIRLIPGCVRFRPGHASISWFGLSASLRLFRDRMSRDMRLFSGFSIRPACVHCARGMHQFPSRLNAGLRLLRSRLNRLASNSRRACVYFLAGQARACVYFGIGMSRACVNSGFRYARHASIAHSACVIFGFGGPGACVHFAFSQAGMRPFPPGHASI